MELKTGDILNCTGKKLLSKIIKMFTKSRFSHTAIFIEIWGEKFIMDAQKDGIQLRPFNQWIKKYDYDFEVRRASFEINQTTFSKRMTSRLGTQYDVKSLVIGQPIEIFTGKWVTDKHEDYTKKLYCSEFVAWCYGVEDFYKMSPQDVYEWQLLNKFEKVN
jgi:hypothetical protein